MSDPWAPGDPAPHKNLGGFECGLSHCKGTLQPHGTGVCPWPRISPILCIQEMSLGESERREVVLRTSKISWARRIGRSVQFVVDGKNDEVILDTVEQAMRVYAEIKSAMFNLPE